MKKVITEIDDVEIQQIFSPSTAQEIYLYENKQIKPTTSY